VSDDGTKGLGGWWPTHDGRYVAYSVKENNSDETTTKIYDVVAARTCRRPDGDQVLGRVVDARRQGFYYTFRPAVEGKVTIADGPARRAALPTRSGHRSGNGISSSTRRPAARRRSSAAASRAMATG